ncbi:hypothetical protein ACIA8K_29795 [Catenuloplanes sp. NPDC051500]|uniref:hypothetical protein n=1 Tax=Catenuloplanes sp. NPDC051500 TaxID=3363959 RepID=UPI003796F451
MTYGRWLDLAEESVHAAAEAARKNRPADHPAAVAALHARRALYADLDRLRHLVNPSPDSPRPAPATATDIRLLIAVNLVGPEDADRLLRAVPSMVLQKRRAAPLAARAEGTVAAELDRAGRALRAGGDVIASHVNPGGAVRSPAGEALRDGAGRAGALGDLAAVAAAMCGADRQIRKWLQRGMRRHRDLRALHGDEVRAMRVLADPALETHFSEMAAFAPPSGLRKLDVADSATVSIHRVHGLDDVAAVMGAVAAGLYRNLENATICGISDACKLGLRAAEATAPFVVQEMWRKSAKIANDLGPKPDTGYALRASVSDAVTVLSNPPFRTQRRAPRHHPSIAAALADLAAGTRQALERELTNGRILAVFTVLSRSSTGLLHLTEKRWEPATSLDDTVLTLVDLLGELADPSTAPRHDGRRLSGSPAAIAAQLDSVGPLVPVARGPTTRTAPSPNQQVPVPVTGARRARSIP